MNIELITTYYREEFLAPLLLMHYSPWVDKITLLTEKFPGGKFDDEVKQGWVNKAIANSQADWVVLVDMDEFIYPMPIGANPRVVLEQEEGNVIYAAMHRVWRHHTDADIDRMMPPVPQRVHGIADHIKPSVFRPRINPQSVMTVGAGNHDIQGLGSDKHGRPWSGAHWANADPCFWIDRETRDRGPRLSQRNIDRGHGTHTLRTREQILAECKAHENDPVIIHL